ncbi:GMC family oxidoreductase [Photobacterium galatheae]|uniref:Glucose-methanol-choline oxidoreductase n=1 Tax=Photobacterium galatheae TaxID=1654360 RepID=A0A066RL43_9GAMM|nr:GMC family oxidoreductase N-terminal domain-containing protein [Photobacterium galatheae]KDM89831.1 glucose-methanol-choline oxidoreductase [Photobacterium galatheae]MCM0151128.1 GMC family oxidoreductase N-terminal domain-containing protein [Photobacterium galatheae]
MSTPQQKALAQGQFDYIVVGGGAAGCVLAARLSEDSSKQVLLLEAGPASDTHLPDSPLNDASRLVLENYNWHYQAKLKGEHQPASEVIRQAAENPVQEKRPQYFDYRVGKVMGGSSAVNGAVALRTFPRDFTAWAEMGCTQWTWEKVLPWYCRLETDTDFPGCAQHGNTGPMVLRRPAPESLHPLDAAFSQACQDLGIPYAADLNAGEAPAVGLVPANVTQLSRRVDVCQSYLLPVMERPNLMVLTEVLVSCIRFEGRSAVGVEVVQEGRSLSFDAHEIVVAAGAIGTPALLQRSGIGDPEHLQALDIPVRVANPAVGRNLQDHASLVLWALPKAGVCHSGLPWRQIAARIASGVDDAADVQIGLLNNVESSTVPKFRDRVDYPMLVGASAMLMQPVARGQVFITSREAEVLPSIHLPLREHDEDIDRMVGAVRQLWQALHAPEVASFLDGVQFWSDAMIGNDRVMHSAVKNMLNPGWHASGTVRMGPETDPNCAAAEDGRVYGVSGLTVADASLFPVIPSMPTNLTTIMLAERIAHALKTGGLDVNA